MKKVFEFFENTWPKVYFRWYSIIRIYNNDIMEHSISEVAKKMWINVSTLRYYDNIGLFNKLKKNNAGNIIFTEENIELLRNV